MCIYLYIYIYDDERHLYLHELMTQSRWKHHRKKLSYVICLISNEKTHLEMDVIMIMIVHAFRLASI
jgi:hypothetical protein